jgi:predicted DCC family thiol-disulfide oxidoreductase YuxK
VTPGAPPDDRPIARLLLFDGDCGICTWWAGRARRLDRREVFTILPYQDVPQADLAPWGVTHADCHEQLHLLFDRRRRRRGAFAVNAFLWRFFPWSVLVAVLYLLPPLLLFEVLGYRLVARHRTAISRRLGLRGCRTAPPSAS